MFVVPSRNVDIKMWTDGVPVEGEAISQLQRMAALPIIYKHLAIMPDVHIGRGATVGSVIPTLKAIIPAAVGVDIGCGMIAVRTSLTTNDLPDSLTNLRIKLEEKIPHGGPGIKGSWGHTRYTNWERIPQLVKNEYKSLKDELKIINSEEKVVANNKDMSLQQLGTLGGGNHFVEICLDKGEDNDNKLSNVWIMLHSGSRGIGNRIGTHYIKLAAQELYEKKGIILSDKNLSYLTDDSENFNKYVRALLWAQKYAYINRRVMMVHALEALKEIISKDFSYDEKGINCHHNYVQLEHHFNQDVWVTRKGAVSAKKDELGIIPGSMGAKSFIVRGKGNEESFHSCSHGAGRQFSRGEAKRRFSLEDHAKATLGVECRKDVGVLDETPAAYKDIDQVMEAQKDLVDIVYELKQIVCVKG